MNDHMDLVKDSFDQKGKVIDTKLSFCSVRYLYALPGGEKFIFRVESITEGMTVNVPSHCSTIKEALDWCRQPRAKVVSG